MYLSLSEIIASEGGTHEAIEALERALALLPTTAPNPARAVEILGGLGTLSRKIGDTVNAEQYFTEMLRIGQVLSTITHVHMDSEDPTNIKIEAIADDFSKRVTHFAMYTVQYADMCRLNSEFQKALTMLGDAVEVLDSNLGSQHRATHEARKCLMLAQVGALHSVPTVLDGCLPNPATNAFEETSTQKNSFSVREYV